MTYPVQGEHVAITRVCNVMDYSLPYRPSMSIGQIVQMNNDGHQTSSYRPLYARPAALPLARWTPLVRERGTATQDAVDAGTRPYHSIRTRPRSRSAHATARRKGQAERRAGPSLAQPRPSRVQA